MEKAEENTVCHLRKPHTRSRTGCLTCRRRKVRCDGDQPSCSRCIKAGRLCEFGSPSLPLRESRSKPLPGQHTWAVDSNQLRPIQWPGLPRPDPVGSLDAYAVQMAFKSKELLYYFSESVEEFSKSSRKNGKDLLGHVVHHPEALRQTLLVAGLHYAWVVGDTREFETTFLHHKIETINMLNEWLLCPRADQLAFVMRNVATLCFTEYTAGNMAVAEAHLDGLMTIMDLHQPLDGDLKTEIEFEEEIANRYLISTCHFLHGIKSRISGSVALAQLFRRDNVARFPEFLSLIHQWHEQHIGRLGFRLKAMGLFPFFSAALPDRIKVHDVDGLPIVECLRVVTECAAITDRKRVNCDPRLIWMEGTVSKLDLALIDAHIASLYGTASETSQSHGVETSLMTSWNGVTIATNLYLHSVLGLWNAGEPIESRLFKRIMHIFLRDITKSEHELKDPGRSDFWFWRVFVGACSLERHGLHVHDPAMLALRTVFDRFLKRWNLHRRIKRWEEAEERLRVITWPVGLDWTAAEAIWLRAMGSDHKTVV